MIFIDDFFRFEEEYDLFEIGKDRNIPIWDLIRYSVYIKYIYPKETLPNISKAAKKNYVDYCWWWLNLFKFAALFIGRKTVKNIFIIHSRNKNYKGYYIDRNADSLIKFSDNNLVLETNLAKNDYNSIHNYCFVFRRFVKRDCLINTWVNKYSDSIIKSLNSKFGISLISSEEIKTILSNYISDVKFYSYMIKRFKPNKIFISTGNPKAIISAARKFNCKTYYIQHCALDKNEIECSYPQSINRDSNILFQDYILTYGDFWCKNMNIPTLQVIPIGNDYFYKIPNTNIDNSILVVSTAIHGKELMKLTKELAYKKNNIIINFKLHPNEYTNNNIYKQYFSKVENVNVIYDDKYDINYLIAKSQLVLLIVSTVIYEALNQNKKVAIYKKINYNKQSHLINDTNVFFIDNIDDLLGVLDSDVGNCKEKYFTPFDKEMASEILRFN